jgi:hypothetical protein
MGRYCRAMDLSRGTGSVALVGSLWFLASGAQAREQPRSEWVDRGAGRKLLYKTTPSGDRIMDFSHAGYMGGGVAIPTVKVKRTVRPSGGADDATAIQAALDEVSALPLEGGFRGAVLLAPGVYSCPRPISIAASGVVLRGSGSKPGRSRTTLKLAGKPHTAITVHAEGAGRGRDSDVVAPVQPGGLGSAITDAYVPAGATSFTVADPSGFAPGDLVVVRRPVTEAWVAFMQMHDLYRDGKPQTWLRPGTFLETERNIKTVAGTRVTLDAPLSDALDARHMQPTGASLLKLAPPTRLRQVGIEHLHIESPLQEISHSQPHFSAMRFQAEDSWARDLVIDETMNSVGIGGRRITFQRVAINRKAKHQGASKPAELAPNGTQILLDRCSVTGDNVWFIATGGRQAGPIVVLNSTFQGKARAEAHQRWSTGMLYDSCRAPQGGFELRNRGAMGSGHGWSMGWGVLWNCQASDYVVQNPPGALNWMIGCVGESRLSPRPFGAGPLLPEGIRDSPGTNVTPRSLYLAQLAERLGPRALRNIGYSSVDPASAGSTPATPRRTPPRASAAGPETLLGENLAVDRPVSTSNVRGGDRALAGWQALDDDDRTYWATDDAITSAELELDTEGALEVNALELREATGLAGRVQSWRVDGLVDSAWKPLAEGTTIGETRVQRFPRVTVWKVRLTILRSAPAPTIRKLGLYLDPTTPPARAPAPQSQR